MGRLSGQKELFHSISEAGGGPFFEKNGLLFLPANEVAETTHRIASAVDLPFLVDADTGFGGVENVGRTVQELESAGAAAQGFDRIGTYDDNEG